MDELRRRVSEVLLGLPGMSLGRRFGGEAFFHKKRFFAHFHPAGKSFYLETYVWNKVDDVLRQVSQVIVHPEYGAYGWVRLPIASEEDLVPARKLVYLTYRYLRTVKRIAIGKERFSKRLFIQVREKMPDVRFSTKVAAKTMIVMMETPEVDDYERAEELLDRAARMLRASE